KGANLWACCPFHGEKSPSFSVSPSKGIYKCFGCGKAGDAVRFIMDIEGIGYPEALKQLAKKYGIEIIEAEYTDEQQEAQNERESLYLVLNFAKNYFQNYLFESEEGQNIGLSYFKERGFNETTIKSFELGFSPKIWDGFTKAAVEVGYSLPILEKAGLTIIKREDDPDSKEKVYDRFRERVIFPIHNVAGKVIAFGGRILKSDKNQPKYVNSPETEVYHKSNVLYGIYQAKNAIRTADMAYLCEGYTDVVSLHQAGIHNVVASSGTSLTIEQIKLIGRFSNNITVLYDGDSAGIKASLRGMDMILEEGLNVKLAVFPEGEDPDSYVQKIGSEAFVAFLKDHSSDFISFKAELSIKEAGDDPVKKAGVIREMVESISKIPDSITRSVFIQKTAQMMGISEDILITESNKYQIQKQKNKEKEFKKSSDKPLENPDFQGLDSFDENSIIELEKTPESTKFENIYYQEKECIRLLLNHGNLIPDKEQAPEYTLTNYILDEIGDLSFETPIFHSILTEIRALFTQNNLVQAHHFHNSPNEEVRNEVISLAFEKYTLSENWNKMHEIIVPTETDKLSELAFTNILRLKKSHNQKNMKEFKHKLSIEKDPIEQEKLLNYFMTAKEIEKELSK
ncbi:MAG: DNA primase, partial [Bacteroidota bacterium]